MKIRRTGLWAGLWAALAALAVFSPLMTAGFVWDDRIVQRDQIPGLASLRDAFYPSSRIPQWSDAYYRPLVSVSYLMDEAANRMVYGAPREPEDRLEPRRARIPHAANLLAHAGVSLLAALLFFRLLSPSPRAFAGALAGGLVFALHPIHVESVANIAGRSDLLAALFTLAATLWALAYVEKGGPGRLALFGLSALAAFFAKEVALAGLLLAPSCLWAGHGATVWTERGKRSRLSALAGAAGAAAALYLALRFSGGNVGGARLAAADFGALADLPAALGYYLRFLVAPVPMQPFVPRLPGAAATAAVLAAGAAALGYCALRLRRGERLPLAAALAILLPLVPALALLPFSLSETPVAERYLYLPSLGIALAAALAAAHPAWEAPLRRRAGVAALAVVLLASAWADTARARVWSDEYRLWRSASETALGASAGLVWVNLGKAAKDRGEAAFSEECYRRALSPEVDYDDEGRAIAWNNLAAAHIEKAGEAAQAGRLSEATTHLLEAEKMLVQAIRLNPSYVSPLNNMGSTQFALASVGKAQTGKTDLARLEAARRHLEMAMKVGIGDARAARMLSRVEQTLRQARAEERLKTSGSPAISPKTR